MCDYVLNDNIQKKKHMRRHSYSHVLYKCDLCDFIGSEEIDMNVHTARVHGENPECGLCDFEAKTLEDLDIHLTTCEYFKCDVCKEKVWQLIKDKEHFISKQKNVDGTREGIININPSREKSEL